MKMKENLGIGYLAQHQQFLSLSPAGIQNTSRERYMTPEQLQSYYSGMVNTYAQLYAPKKDPAEEAAEREVDSWYNEWGLDPL